MILHDISSLSSNHEAKVAATVNDGTDKPTIQGIGGGARCKMQTFSLCCLHWLLSDLPRTVLQCGKPILCKCGSPSVATVLTAVLPTPFSLLVCCVLNDAGKHCLFVFHRI